MADDHHYKQLIFTNHALERMKRRSISADAVWRVVQSPDQTLAQEKPGTTKFIRTLEGRLYHIVGTLLPEKHKTLIISVWVRGEDDKEPLAWQLITLPFRILFWVAQRIFRSKR